MLYIYFFSVLALHTYQSNVSLLRATVCVLTVHAADFWDIPSSIPTTTDSWDMSLNKAYTALVPHQRVDLIPFTCLPKGTCILYHRRLTTGHCKPDETKAFDKEFYRNYGFAFLPKENFKKWIFLFVCFLPVPFLQVKVRW